MAKFTRTQTFKRIHAAKLAATVGPAPVTKLPWFLPWMLYMKVGTPGGYRRPTFPGHIRQAEFPGFFQESARIDLWRQRKQAGMQRPALGLWQGGVLPKYAALVSKEMDRVGIHKPTPQPPTPVPVPVPPHVNPLLVQRAQKVVFTAWRPFDGFVSHGGGRITFSADLNVGGSPAQHFDVVKQAVKHAKEIGIEPSIWGNQSQVGIDHMWSFASQMEAPYIIWQAETVGEMVDVGINEDGSLRAGSPLDRGDVVLVGNANAWTGAQRATAQKFILEGRLAFQQETYTNCGDPWPNQFGTQGVTCHALVLGIGWGPSPFQMPSYKPNTPDVFWPTICTYIGEDYDQSSRDFMPY